MALTADEKYMKEAKKQAMKAYALGEVPIGCVIVYEDKIIARGYNRRNKCYPKGQQKAGGLEAGRLYFVCNSGALSDVRRCHCPGKDRPGSHCCYESKSRLRRLCAEPA